MYSNFGNQRRTHESPMDWEWQTKGPTDPNSPFPQFKPQPGQNSNFESPKPQPSSFMKASSTPAPQFRNPSFTTPRKPFDPDLFSEASGAESSPADNADAEDTPDVPKPSSTMTAFTGGSERKPLFGRYGADFLGTSPGRAEQRRGKYGTSIIQKMRKRKRLERDYTVSKSHHHRGDYDSDSDSSTSRPASKGKTEEQKPGWIANLLNGIETRPNLPHLLSIYTQLFSNLGLLALTIYGIWTFWTAVRADVDKASEDARGIVMAEIAKCARDYVDNKCGRDLRAPALEPVCNAWEVCMNRDPNSVGRAKVSAHTFAQIFNSFIEPISYKAMIFIILTVIVVIIVNNLAFSMFRSTKTHPPPFPHAYPPPTPQNFQWGSAPQPPQTPQHAISYDQWGNGGNGGYPAIMPTPSQRSPSKEGRRSPSKGY